MADFFPEDLIREIVNVDFLAKLDSQLESLLYNYIRNIPMKTKPASCIPYYLKTFFSDKAKGIREPLCYVVALPDVQADPPVSHGAESVFVVGVSRADWC